MGLRFKSRNVWRLYTTVRAVSTGAGTGSAERQVFSVEGTRIIWFVFRTFALDTPHFKLVLHEFGHNTDKIFYGLHTFVERGLFFRQQL